MRSDVSENGETIYQIGEYRVSPSVNSIHGPAGSLRLKPRTMYVLAYLIRNAPQVVSTGELLERFWQDRIVDEHAIHRRISEIRKSFGDDPRQPVFTETVPKRGYRLIAPVESVDAPGNLAPIRDAVAKRTAANAAFVGREDVLQRLSNELERAALGSSGFVFLSGPPGIGKTRTARRS